MVQVAFVGVITFETFSFQYLTRCLMLKLIVLTQETITE